MTEEELKEKQISEIEQKKKDYLATFSTDEGKRVLADLKQTCFMNRSTYSAQREKTFINEGMRMVVVHIENMMNFELKRIIELVQKGD